MVIQRFNDIVFEKKLDFFLYSLDEGLSFEDFKDKVKRYLPNIKTKEQAKNFLLGNFKFVCIVSRNFGYDFYGQV